MDTKNIISSALQTLLKSKKMDNITVQNILDTAHVSRSTFYSHFKDKFDLMTWFYKSYLDNLQGLDNIHFFRANLISSFKFLKDNSSYFGKVLRTSNSTALEDLIYTHAFDLYCTLYRKYLGENSLTKKNIFKIRLLCYGSTAVACSWIRNGCVEEPEFIGEVITEMVPYELMKFDQ